jgi:pimeloyl-ACP methyl ester carboxylesterase
MQKLFCYLLPLILCITGFGVISDPPGLLHFKDASGDIRPVTDLAEWEQKRWQILEGMEDVMGALPDRSELPPLDMQITDTLATERYYRLTIRFAAAKGEVVPAYLYIPFRKGVSGKLPAMLVLHGTGDAGKRLVDGESPLPNRAHAKELAERGYIVIAPDYPGMGDLRGHDFQNDRYESGTMKGIFNHMRSVDLLLSREDVDPDRIGVLGHSLGGHNAMFAAAFDTRLKVIVSSCGWTQMDYYDIGEVADERFGGRLGPWAQDRYMPRIRDKFELDGEKLPFDFHEVIALLAPRPFFSNSPVNDSNFDVEGVRQGISLASEAYRFLGAEGNLQVRYPEAEHDFPVQTRKEAYRFIDKKFNHIPTNHVIE